ncbi:acyltransferase [Betaproteobacteria bacterium]|nr:acyltransferase [Betaproteobacteria bacterium]GHU15773.1 acyltransferase [Betaproteobacteria bacterium]GHU21650.1 acyltransferase [Betaproteobacteria bacterium]
MSAPRPEVTAEWAQRPERSNMLALRLMAWLSLTLGRRASRVILALIAAYFVAFAPAARRASKAYLRRALGRKAIVSDGFRHVFSFAATVHDRIYLLRDRFDLFDIRLEGVGLIDEMLREGRGALLFGAHLGSFEVIRAVGNTRPDLKIAMAMFEDNAKMINTLLAAINPTHRPEVIALGRLDAMLKIRDQLDHGALVGVLADRSPGDEPRAQVPVLGQPAALPVGPFRMAAMLGARVIFMAGLYCGDNRYTIRFAPIADFAGLAATERAAAIERSMTAYADEMTRCCLEAPSNWFNYFDFWDEFH